MLFHQLAVDPEALEEANVRFLLTHLVGLSKGRVVCNFPTGWKDQVRHAAKKFDPHTQHLIKNLMLRAEFIESVLTLPSLPTSPDWLIATEALKKEKDFDVIISDRIEATHTYKNHNALEYAELSESSVGYLDISKVESEQSVVNNLAPFLIKNKFVTIINPSQKLMTSLKTKTLFKELFKFWIRQGGHTFRVFASSRHVMSADFEREVIELKRFLTSVNFKGKFTYLTLDDNLNRMHERYMVGPFCTIELGYGLELTKKPHTWKIVNKGTHKHIREVFFDPDIRDCYEVVDQFVWPLS